MYYLKRIPHLLYHLLPIVIVFGGHVICMNIPIRKEDGFYIYFLKAKGILCLLLRVWEGAEMRFKIVAIS
jgi:hypothetical protein